jgi:hypothetical protein
VAAASADDAKDSKVTNASIVSVSFSCLRQKILTQI